MPIGLIVKCVAAPRQHFVGLGLLYWTSWWIDLTGGAVELKEDIKLGLHHELIQLKQLKFVI